MRIKPLWWYRIKTWWMYGKWFGLSFRQRVIRDRILAQIARNRQKNRYRELLIEANEMSQKRFVLSTAIEAIEAIQDHPDLHSNYVAGLLQLLEAETQRRL